MREMHGKTEKDTGRVMKITPRQLSNLILKIKPVKRDHEQIIDFGGVLVEIKISMN